LIFSKVHSWFKQIVPSIKLTYTFARRQQTRWIEYSTSTIRY
jgi:hypothetical protein